ncbi:MAG: pilus assembly protein PilM [Wenzhouxiangellaceae bacterium]
MGLDIGSGAVKLLQLSRSGGGFRVDHFAHEALPKGALADGNINDTEVVSETIRRAVQRAGTKAKHCVVAVSGSSVINRVINLPASLSDLELESRVELEAGQHIPYPLNEVNVDFEVLGPAPRNAELIEVLLVASRKENIDMRRSVVEDAGLSARVVDVEAFAVANAYEDFIAPRENIPEDQTVALIDIGSNSTSLIVVQDRRLVYTREQPFGGRSLLDDIQRRYGDEMADYDFASADSAPPGFEDEILQPFKQQIVQQISRALQFYASSSNYSAVSRIFLAGGCASIDGLGQMVDDELGISAEVADPIEGMRVAGTVSGNLLQRHAPGLMVVAGLALRGIE